MNLIFKIAWRNIQRHKGKSIVVGIILFLGALLMTVGNGIISGMDKGLAKNIVKGFTGDIVLVSDKQESDNVYIVMMGKAVEPINNYPVVRDLLAQQDYIDKYLPVGKNMAMVLNEDGGDPGYCFLYGVDFARFQEMFPGIMEIKEGRLLEKGEIGAVLPLDARNQIYEETTGWYIPEGDTVHRANLSDEAKEEGGNLSVKNSVVFMGASLTNSTSDVRLPVRGVIKYRALNKIWGHFILVDIESYRRCLGYFSASDKAVIVPENDKKLLMSDNTNLDALFSSGDLIIDNVNKKVATEAAPATEEPSPNLNITPVDDGTYNMVLVSLKNSNSLNENVNKLNKLFKEKNAGVRAMTWKKAIGVIGSMAMLIKSALFIFVMFLFFVAIIIIINTLSMAALERTSEIGMMRAVGSRKGFIAGMFLGETAILSGLFGGAGIALGILAVNIIARLHITSDNDAVQLLFGGDTFAPTLSAGDVGLALIQLVLVTVIAVIYPIKLARSITPLDAIIRD